MTYASNSSNTVTIPYMKPLMVRRTLMVRWSFSLSLGTILSSVGCPSTFVWSMKLMALTRFRSF